MGGECAGYLGYLVPPLKIFEGVLRRIKKQEKCPKIPPWVSQAMPFCIGHTDTGPSSDFQTVYDHQKLAYMYLKLVLNNKPHCSCHTSSLINKYNGFIKRIIILLIIISDYICLPVSTQPNRRDNRQ